jgi:hypothetical protein
MPTQPTTGDQMPDPLHAPPGLIVFVREQVLMQGRTFHKSNTKVVPFVQITERFNRWTPIGQPRWIAECPECPGAEVVPAEGEFECGSCGATAEVDWSKT